MAKCPAKHTVYQPKDDEWVCPNCGAGNQEFYIDELAPGADEECIKIHNDDYIICGCGHSWSGKRLSTIMMKKANLVPCPHCRGKGVVKK